MSARAGRTRLVATVSTIMVLIAAVLVGISVYLYVGNRALQAEVNQRQRFINDTVRLNQLNNEVIQALATLATQDRDLQIRDLLVANGITFSFDAPPSVGDGGQPPVAEPGKPASE